MSLIFFDSNWIKTGSNQPDPNWIGPGSDQHSSNWAGSDQHDATRIIMFF
jgi:hypothetical protein